MNRFLEYFTNLKHEFTTCGYRHAAISPPADLDIPKICEWDWRMDFHYVEGKHTYGVTLSEISVVASRETFRELGLLLIVCALMRTHEFRIEVQQKYVPHEGLWIKPGSEDHALLIHYKCGLPLECYDFPVTGVHYVYAWDDDAADRRTWAKVDRNDRPSFGYYDQTKYIGFDFADVPTWVNRAIYIGAGAGALLRLGGALLDFSHPESDAEFLELERNFEQVGVHSYDAHFFIAGSESADLVFGYDTIGLCKEP